MLKIFMVWGSKRQGNIANWGQNLHENLCVKNYTKSMQKYKATT